MKIETNFANIESARDSYGDCAMLSVRQCINGMGFSLMLSPACNGEFYLCKKDGFIFLCGIPSNRWKDDLRDDGFEILSRVITRNEPDSILKKEEKK